LVDTAERQTGDSWKIVANGADTMAYA